MSLPPLTQESNLGDDGLTLQSTYDVNINDEEHQVSLGADPHLLVASMPPNDQLEKHYTKLLLGITSIKQVTLRGNTLSALRRRGELMDLRIADVSAKDVMLQIDDAEFQDWCASNSYTPFWHCSQVNNSAILQLAIKNSIQKCPHPHLESIFDELDDIQPKFVGFVTAQIQDKVVKAFHIHSFALYYTQNIMLSSKPTNTTVVICILTSRIHMQSMMQDCVLQVLQLLQHEETGDFSMSLTNQFIGIDGILNDSSISGYENMGFNVKSMTQDVHQGQFTITTDDPIPLMPYSDRYTWAKYGHFILHNKIISADNTAAGSDDESPTDPNKQSMADNNNSLTVNHCDCLISFLWTDPDGAASFIVDASSTCLIDEFLNKFDCRPKKLRKDTFLMRSLSKMQTSQS